MNVCRGDVVIVDFPYAGGGGGKVRPALVVQNDRDNQRLTNTVIAMISGNIRHAHETTQLLVDPATPEGRSSGLHGPSVVKFLSLHTIRHADVIRIVGRLSNPLVDKVNICLKDALGVS